MMKGLVLDECVSNMTSTISGETSVSSNTRNESSSTITTTNNNNNNMLYASPNQVHQAPHDEPPPAKKKRSLPGNPDPDAEVIALSPKSLLATNRFLCEICNKGFQRDQNLQLHRRGHNLPWKLKQRAKTDVIRKKVYVCPETSCVHHDPSRALGDLTGIKKHFCRKHGEKKWKCEKCSKKYAVQSDWKAHSKICGTREYRCDCGTLFSRRDSFITHRAFCDALAEESGRGINPLSTFPSSVTTSTAALSHISSLSPHLTSHHHQLLQNFPMKREVQDHHHSSHMVNIRTDIPPWLACPPPPPPQQTQIDQQGMSVVSSAQLDHQAAQMFSFQAQYDQNQHGATLNVGPTLSTFQSSLPSHPQLSATALLQRAAEMGVTVSNQQHQHQHQQHGDNGSNNNNNSCQQMSGLSSLSNEQEQQHHQRLITDNTSVGLTSDDNNGLISGGGGQTSSMLHDHVMLMNSMQSTTGVSGFDSSSFGEFQQQSMAERKTQLDNNGGNRGGSGSGNGGGGGHEGMTRDFLGLRTFSHKDFLNMAGLGHLSSTSSASYNQEQQNQTPW